jgi:hypothetical protein
VVARAPRRGDVASNGSPVRAAGHRRLTAAHGVRRVWLIDPIAKTLEVPSLDGSHRWRDVRVYERAVRVRADHELSNA